ncbi:MAG: hypothetical protein FWG41_03495 [Methanomassiliicoccaceae archaeon]|nr:hypothetical protein [Methanomassiliicoccaceae archaeon]
MAKGQERYLFGVDARVLLLLLKHGEIKRSDFYKKYGVSYNASNAALDVFLKLGVTSFEECGDFRDTVVWRLTEKGEKIAQELSDLMSFIEKE